MWNFINDPNNRSVLSWIGGGIIVTISGLWATYKYFMRNAKRNDIPTVRADHGSVAAGRDIKGTIRLDGARNKGRSK